MERLDAEPASGQEVASERWASRAKAVAALCVSATDLRMMTEGTLVSRGRVVLLLDCESADESGAKEALWQLAPYCDVRVRIELKVSYQHGCKSSVKAPIALPG